MWSFRMHETGTQNKGSKTFPVPTEDCEVKGSVQDSAYFYLGKGYCKLMHVEERMSYGRD